MPVYRVTLAGVKHIVVANLSSQAIRHVTRKDVVCETITAEELADEIAAGYRIEKADLQGTDSAASPIDITFNHKPGCAAGNTVPIGIAPCRCTELNL